MSESAARMTQQTICLTDTDSGIWHDAFSLTAEQGTKLAGSDSWAITKQTLRGGRSDGVDVVELDNGLLSVSVLPTRGMGLWKGRHGDLPLGWNSPVRRPVHPSFMDLTERSGLGWLTGFNEWMCRCGLSSHGAPGLDSAIDNNGNPIETPLTLHGKIACLPAHHVEVTVDPAAADGRGSLSVTGVVDETMMFGPALQLRSTLRTVAGSSTLEITDEITNTGGQPTELELLYHTNFGRPFLEEGACFAAPVAQVAPVNARAAEDVATWTRYRGPQAGYVEQCYFVDLLGDDDRASLAVLHNSAASCGVRLDFSLRELPHFTLWKNTQAEADGCVTGLEPGTSFPNHRRKEREQGRVISLEPAQTYTARLGITVLADSEAVAASLADVARLQASAEPHVHSQPLPDFPLK